MRDADLVVHLRPDEPRRPPDVRSLRAPATVKWPPVHRPLPRSARELVASEVGALGFRRDYGMVRASLTLPCGCRWDGAASWSPISALVALVTTVEQMPIPGHELR